MKYLKQFTQFLSEMIFFRQLFFLNNWEWGSGWTPIEIIISLLFLIKFPMEGKKAPNVMQVPFFLKQYLTPTPVARGRDGLLEERCFGSLCISDQQFHGWQKNGARSGFPDRPMAHYNFSIGNSSTRRGDFPLPCRIWKIVTASRCLPKEKIKKGGSFMCHHSYCASLANKWQSQVLISSGYLPWTYSSNKVQVAIWELSPAWSPELWQQR